MGIYSNLTKQLRDAYLNCFLPSDDVLKESLKKYLNVNGEVIERNEEHLLLLVKFDNDKMTFKFSFKLASNGRLIVSDIVLNNIED